jgi:beta-ring hydroxylase
MIGLFGEASHRLCEKLDKAAADGEDVEMESLFSRLTLDVIGKAVFNYDFDSLSYDNGIVEVIHSSFPLFPVSFIYFSWRLKPFPLCNHDQAVYVTLREAEMRSTSPIPTWEIPIWKDISPRQKKVNEALKLINSTLDELIAICKVRHFVVSNTFIVLLYMFGFRKIMTVILPIVINAENGRARRSSVS